MNSSIQVIISTIVDPFVNLAIEEFYFRHKTSTPILMLWRNKPCIVIGRAQNPWLECNTAELDKQQIPLVRRYSGGGTVYHDLGNLNFSFIGPKSSYDKKRQTQMVCQALNDLDIQAYANERNDILVDGFKVSGSAYRESKDVAYHHGTLLLNADVANLRTLLNVSKNIQAKGVRSVKSKVMNLSEIIPSLSYESVCNQLIETFSDFHQQHASVQYFTFSDMRAEMQEQVNMLQTWEWRFAKTLPFVHRFEAQFDFGHLQAEITVEKGVIEAINIEGNQNKNLFNPLVTNSLLKAPYLPSSIDEVSIQSPLHARIIDWISENIR